MARILLGVSGGIAAYKALELARLATLAGHGVRVLMTPAAERFVGRASFEGIVGAPVLTDEFERDPLRGAYPGDPEPEHDPIGHLAVAERADAMLVAPATANTLSKLAAGAADSMLSAAFLACAAPRAVAPAMNDRMYGDAATQANLAALRDRGVRVIEAETGALASRGEFGAGRMPPPEFLLAELESILPAGHRPWDGLRVLITAGGTREPIDAVRFVGNRSSGRMGLALAGRAAKRGAEVTLIAAGVAGREAPGVRRIDVETAAELAGAVDEAFKEAHVLLMAAAVADFTPERTSEGKLAREGGNGLDLHLVATKDILAEICSRRRPEQVVVGFAAEHGPEAIARARAKLARKGADAIVFNDISRGDVGFDSERNEVTVVEAESEVVVQRAPKGEVAEAILDRVDALRAAKGALSA